MHTLGIGGATIFGPISLFPPVLTKVKTPKFNLFIPDIRD